MIKINSEQEKVELTIKGESDEILAELENVCRLILKKVSQIEGCDSEQLTYFFTQNLCRKGKMNFICGIEDDLN